MNPVEFLIAFVLTKAKDQPVPDRIRLYRGLALICGDGIEQRTFNQMAAALSEGEINFRALELSLIEKGKLHA